jgi:hypothetical protein
MATKPYVISGGWLSEVFGHPVRKVDMTYIDHTRYWSGAPRGPFWHYTAGCGTNLAGTIESRGYNICTLSIDRDGVIYQYLPLAYAAWHAYDASYNYIGVEHSGLPGSCNLTDAEYEASVALFAALVLWIKAEYGRTVNVEHNGGCGLTAYAFKEHADGIGCSWNPKTHTDGLDPAGWSWPTFLGDVQAKIDGGEEDELDADQAQQLNDTYLFTRWLVRGINGSGAPASDAPDQAANGYKAGQELKAVRQWQHGFADQRAGKPKPSDPDAAEGWNAAKNG